MILNIIHLQSSLFQFKSVEYYESIKRKESFEKEMNEQGIKYVVWDGIIDASPCAGISKAHKKIVQWAKERCLKRVCICEDDIKFNGVGAWDFFIKNIPESFDMYMGVSYFPGSYENGIVDKPFDSLTLYIIHERFYDDFLALPENNHIDRELSRLVDKKEFRIVDKYICYQSNGYSFNAKREREYHERIAEMPKYVSEVSL